jgi:ribosome-associated toxin RatA of RatAB toxin-antitoxin module
MVTKIQNSAEIGTTPENVSKYLWDVKNLPNYLPMSKVRVLEKRGDYIKLGHKFTAARMSMNQVCEFNRLENDRKLEYRTIKGMNVKGSWIIEPTDKATNLTYIVEYTPPGWIFGSILNRFVIEREMKRISLEALQKLTGILGGKA